MLTVTKIKDLFICLNKELANKNVLGEIGVVGGAAMCLVYKARPSTKDVDAIFEPSLIIRKLAKKIALEKNITEDWLNDAVKGYIHGKFKRNTILRYSNLTVWSPQPEYLLAMKCISARWGTHDSDDVKYLIKHLKLKTSSSVISLVEKYYSKNIIPIKTVYFIEELFEI